MQLNKKLILISGWRGLPHSYALVAQFLSLEILRRPELQLFFEDVPYFSSNWNSITGLFSAEDEAAIARIPSATEGVTFDIEIRTGFPLDFITPPRAKATLVFGTSEHRIVPPEFLVGGMSLAEAHRLYDFYVMAPSRWSCDGFIRSGADADRTLVIPIGFEPRVFRPPNERERGAARESIGIAETEFVFLNIGAMTGNKNIGMLLRAFASTLRRHPTAKLVLKGMDSLYQSQRMFMTTALQSLTPDDAQLALPRTVYLGRPFSLAEMAALYHAADCYVSPYTAEGFNMPVLESAACGLPIICTADGPTDDFTLDTFARKIRSTEIETPAGTELSPDAKHLERLMHEVIDDWEFRERASVAGPAFVAERFTWKHVVDEILKLGQL